MSLINIYRGEIMMTDKIENKEAIATSDEEIEENSEVALSQNQTSEQAEQN